MENTIADVCLVCLHEQVEAGEESKRWAAYLLTNPKLPILHNKKSSTVSSSVKLRKCLKCRISHFSAETCRVTLGHTAPYWKVTQAAEEPEQEDVLDKRKDGDQHMPCMQSR